MVALADASGYTRWASSRTNEEMNKTRKLQGRGGQVETAMVRNGRAYAESQRAQGKDMTDQEGINYFAESSMGGTSAGKVNISEDSIYDWEKGGFSDLPYEELRKNPEAGRLVRRIELAHPLSKDDKNELKEISGMIDLSESASGLTESQIGILDSTWTTVKSYVSDEVENPGAKSAYNALLNQFRNNLFGATLTDGETAMFEKAFGSQNRGAGTLFEGLSTITSQLASRLERVIAMNEPAVVQYRTGKTVQQLEQVINTLNEKTAKYSTGATEYKKKDATTSTTKKPLNSIFGGGNP